MPDDEVLIDIRTGRIYIYIYIGGIFLSLSLPNTRGSEENPATTGIYLDNADSKYLYISLHLYFNVKMIVVRYSKQCIVQISRVLVESSKGNTFQPLLILSVHFTEEAGCE